MTQVDDRPHGLPTSVGTLRGSRSRAPWWRDAVVYQVYVRSFADGNGDGTGDLAGVRARLPYLRELGVDALWFNPWYPSPLADNGYDIVDYRAIDPDLRDARGGGGADRRGARSSACARSSTSSRTTSRASIRGFARRSPRRRVRRERSRFWFRPGRGADGEQPPNGWQLDLRRLGVDAGRPTASGISISSRPSSPTSTGRTPTCWAEHEDVLRFWFDRGVAGVRIDSAALLDQGPGARRRDDRTAAPGEHPFMDRDELHEVYRGWRAVADGYDGAEAARRRDLASRRRPARALPAARRAAHRLQLRLPLLPVGPRTRCARTIESALATHAPIDAPADVGALEPRRHAAGDALRARGHLVLVRGEARRHADRPRARHAPRPGRGAA